MPLSYRDKTVLIVGANPRTVAVIEQFRQAGAQVSISAAELPVAVADLIHRGLITRHRGDGSGFDIVWRESESPEPQPTIERNPDLGPPRVLLVGGGPGSPGLLTWAGQIALTEADTIVYDRLAPLSCLELAKPGAELIDVGKIPRGRQTAQEAINQLLIDLARQGKQVVRFKGGDSYVFGRGGEEAQALTAAGIPVSVIPGVSSALAAPALAGIPVTHRGLTQGFTVISGHLGPDHPDSTLNWDSLATTTTTLVILMGVKALPEIVTDLISRGMDPQKPAAVIADAALPSMRVVRGTLSELPSLVAEAQIQPPAITVIGDVAALEL